MKTSDLFERYAFAVAQQLPRKMQADIQLELSSLLQDALEERALETGKDPNEKMAVDILHEFGRPNKMAAQYRPERYLIGPALFPNFLFTLKLVGVIFAIFYGILLALPFLTGVEYSNFGRYAWEVMLEMGSSYLFSVGVILAIFAAIEYFIDPADLASTESEAKWDPLSLPQVVEKGARIKRGELIFGIVVTALMIVLFNIYPEKIGYVGAVGETAVVFPLLAPEFFVHVPWLTATWVLDIILKLTVLQNGRWTQITRWMAFAFTLFGLYVLYRILAGGPILAIDGLNIFVKFALRIAVVVTIIDLFGKLYQLLFKRPLPFSETFKSRPA